MTITIVGGGNPSAPTFPVQRSVRLRSSASAYFNRTPASAGNRKTWTWSGWVKRGTIGGTQVLFANNFNGSGGLHYIQFNSDTLFMYVELSTSIKTSWATTAVFRDPSAWYHVVVVFDTTQSVVANMGKVYVNGVLQTTTIANYSASYISQNADGWINASGYAHNIGSGLPALSGQNFDGYLTEVNFIDGQALTPTSFGAYNNYGVWSPAKYTGTYGTNGFYLPFTTNTNSETLGLDYANTNPELITNGMFTANVTGWTVTPSTGGSPSITWQSAHTARLANINAFGAIYYQAIPTVIGQTYYAQCYTSNISLGGSTRVAQMIKGDNVNFSTNLVVIGNVQQSAGAGGIRNTFVATATTTYIGIQADIGGVSGSADFTQISVALGGYKNSWNPFNISTTAGVTYDSMLDVPTLTSATNANFAVMNPLARSTFVGSSSNPSTGNLVIYQATTASWAEIIATMGASSGKWYWEIHCSNLTSISNLMLGVVTEAEFSNLNSSNKYVGSNTAGYGYYSFNGNKYNNGVSTAYGSAYVDNDIVGVALDMDAGTLTFYKNGVSQGIAFSGLTGTMFPAFSSVSGVGNVTFGQRPFTHTPPSGFKSLNTYNLPAPTIPNGAAYMAATTYTGNGSTQSILNSANTTTGVSFQPDFVWVKSRSSGTQSHELFDSVRGVSKPLNSSNTNAEVTYAGQSLTAFNSNGFTVVDDAAGNLWVNGSTGSPTYIGWQWKANGTPAVTNTSGSIPSTISANTTAGFSIVTYTSQTSGTATIGHGLGVAPALIINKPRTGAVAWTVYHQAMGNNAYLILNTTAAFVTGATTVWNSTSPSSTVFTQGSAFAGFGTMVAYCWAEIPGFSKFGSYTGNGSTDGPFVYCGFRPRWVMYKRIDAAGYSWAIWDTSRDTSNVVDLYLWANSSQAETSFAALDIVSNGFKLRTADAGNNGSGGTYIYAAFAENPFNYSLAR